MYSLELIDPADVFASLCNVQTANIVENRTATVETIDVYKNPKRFLGDANQQCHARYACAARACGRGWDVGCLRDWTSLTSPKIQSSLLVMVEKFVKF